MPDAKLKPTILILTVPHGASHRNAASALARALMEIEPGARVEVADALAWSAAWFRAYYNSYEIPLKLWPGLWGWIESVQHQSASTGPGWLYRRGARPLYWYIESLDPDVVVATEVGVSEIAALHKRHSGARYRLAGVELMDFNRAWVQPEVDLYLVTHQDLGHELAAAGAAREKIVASGQPIDPKFALLPPRDETRARLGLDPALPLVLVLFGGTGHGKPSRIVRELKRVDAPHQAVFITGRNRRLEQAIGNVAAELPRSRVLGWADNVHEWMVSADLMISKPGGSTLTEGFACGLPMLAYDPLPGNEQRTCAWIEKWGVGVWIHKTEDLAPSVDRLLGSREDLVRLRDRASALARPNAARDGARAILELARRTGSPSPSERDSSLRGMTRLGSPSG